MSKLYLKDVGTKHFGPVVDITDPGYDRDVWCRINNLKIKEGDYRCIVWTQSKYYTNCDGERYRDTRVGRLGIYLGEIPIVSKLEEIGFIGVDAGLAGIFNNKPDYTGEEWEKLCNKTFKGNKKAWIFDEGFFSSSGYGDGEYPVFAEKDENGDIVSLEIVFI